MTEISIRQLRHHGAEAVDRVTRGEEVTVTRNRQAVARMLPPARLALSSGALVRRWSKLPPVDPDRFRQDIDAIIDSRT